jgi:hypothetical protein
MLFATLISGLYHNCDILFYGLDIYCILSRLETKVIDCHMIGIKLNSMTNLYTVGQNP